MNYLIIECECEEVKIPKCITNDYSSYNIYGYEIYPINENGTIGSRIKDFDEDGRPIEIAVYRYIDDAEEDYEGISDLEILEIIKTKYASNTYEVRKKIANSTNFSKLVKKYLDLSAATQEDYKRDFTNIGACTEYDYIDKEDAIIISLKQGNRVIRTY